MPGRVFTWPMLYIGALDGVAEGGDDFTTIGHDGHQHVLPDLPPEQVALGTCGLRQVDICQCEIGQADN